MVIFKEAATLSQYLQQQALGGRSIGFVPTMGALHEGHLSLIRKSQEMAGYTVCSIFINPTQFNNPEDFRNYPVTIEQDIEKLVSAGCDLLFLPSVAEIYPEGYRQPHYDLGPIETVLEGAFRPGHFQGVCAVVDRLLQIVNPHHLFMGQKDYQQCIVVNRMLKLTGRLEAIRLHLAPTAREQDGLAMSSRNLRLTPDQRQLAPALFQVLSYVRDHRGQASAQALEEEAGRRLQAAGFQTDYVSIRSSADLMPATNGETEVALVAASLGPVRLIDNLLLS